MRSTKVATRNSDVGRSWWSPVARYRRIAWILVAIYAPMALCGEGLHLLPGLGHSCCEPCVTTCHLYHGEYHGTISRTSDGHSAQRRTERSTGLRCFLNRSHSHADSIFAHDCPICRFFAEAKTVATTAASEVSAELSSPAAVHPAPTTFSAPRRSYDPRGPPVGPSAG